MPQSPRKIRVTRFTETGVFYTKSASFLLKREAEHNLILGLCGNLLKQPTPAYHAVVERSGRVLAAALRTPPHNLILSHTSYPNALALIALDVYEMYGTIPGVIGTHAQLFAALWEKLSGQIPFLSAKQRIYQLEKARPITGVAGQMCHATEHHRELVLAWLNGFYRDTEDDDQRSREENERVADRFLKTPAAGLVLWEVDGQLVSMAGYTSPTPHGIRISAVYTPPEYRRNGYASACVTTLSQFLLSQGYKFCFLFTDLNNPTSNHIYQEIGYTPVRDVDIYEFI